MRRRQTVGAVGQQLSTPQIIGLHVILAHGIIEFIDFVIRVDGPVVLLVLEIGKCHIAVDLLTPYGVGILLHIAAETLAILVQVKGQLGVIKMGVFRDFRIIFRSGRFLESLHRGHLVLQLKIAVRHLVIGNLAQ